MVGAAKRPCANVSIGREQAIGLHPVLPPFAKICAEPGQIGKCPLLGIRTDAGQKARTFLAFAKLRQPNPAGLAKIRNP